MTAKINIRMVGETIRTLRQSRNWTQEDLAAISGYSVRNLRRIETDGTGNIDVVNNFADIFQVSAVDILKGCLLFLFVPSPSAEGLGIAPRPLTVGGLNGYTLGGLLSAAQSRVLFYLLRRISRTRIAKASAKARTTNCSRSSAEGLGIAPRPLTVGGLDGYT